MATWLRDDSDLTVTTGIASTTVGSVRITGTTVGLDSNTDILSFESDTLNITEQLKLTDKNILLNNGGTNKITLNATTGVISATSFTGNITSGAYTGTPIANAYIASGLDATKIGDGSISNTEFQFLNSIGSNIQTQLNAKHATIDASNRLDASYIGANGNVSSTEYGYLSNVSSDIQAQLDTKPTGVYSPATNDYAKFDSNGDLAGRTYSEVRSDLGISDIEIVDWTADQGSNNIHVNNITGNLSIGSLTVSSDITLQNAELISNSTDEFVRIAATGSEDRMLLLLQSGATHRDVGLVMYEGAQIRWSMQHDASDDDDYSLVWDFATPIAGADTKMDLDSSGNLEITGDLTVSGGDITGATDADLTVHSDGNISFILDDDNDETGQKFYFYNDTTEIATLNESGDLQIDGDLTVSGGNITNHVTFDDKLTVTSITYLGNLVWLNGSTANIAFGSGLDTFFVHDDSTSGSTGGITLQKNTVLTDSVMDIFTLHLATSDTPAAGIGSGIAFKQETAATHHETMGHYQLVTTDVSSGSEDADFVWKLMAAGATAAEKMRLTSVGNLTIAGDLTVSGGNITNAITFDSGITDSGTISAGTWSGTALVDGKIASASTWNAKQDALTFGISNTNVAKCGSGIVDNDFIRVDGTTLEGRSASEVLSDIGGQASGSYITGTGSLSAQDLTDIGNLSGTNTGDQSTGISDGNVLTANDAVADNDFLRIDGTEVEGRSASEVRSDIGAGTSSVGALNDLSDVTYSSGDLTISSLDTIVATTLQLTLDDGEQAPFAGVIDGQSNSFFEFGGEAGSYSSLIMNELGGDSSTDYFKINVDEHGATTLSTVDGAAQAAHMLLNTDGYIYLAPSPLTADGTILDRNITNTSAGTYNGLYIDYDKIGTSTSNNTIRGLYINTSNTTATNGTNTMYGIYSISTLGHAADAGTANTIGAHISANGAANGASTSTGMQLLSSGADANIGLEITCADGGKDFIIKSSADAADYCVMSVGASGATTLTTNDDGAAIAHLSLNVDGDITLKPDAAGGNVYINDGSNNIFDFNAVSTTLTIHDDTDTADKFRIAVGTHGATTFTTVDDGAAIAHLSYQVDGHIDMNTSAVGFTQTAPTFDNTDTYVRFDTTGNKQKLTLTDNCVDIHFRFPAISGNFLCVILQDGTGGRTIDNWKTQDSDGNAGEGNAGNVKWAAGSQDTGTDPDNTETADKADIASFYWDAVSETAYGVYSKDF